MEFEPFNVEIKPGGMAVYFNGIPYFKGANFRWNFPSKGVVYGK